MDRELINNVRIRPIRAEELELVMEWRMRPDITKYMYTDPLLTPEGQKRWFLEQRDRTDQYSLIVEVDGIPCGVLSITDIDRKNSRCSWGIYIAVKEKRSLELMLALEWNVYDFVFYELGLSKVWGEVFSFNKAVIRMHQMCGSRIEGTLRKHILKNGEFYDVTLVGICRDEWETIQKKYPYGKIPVYITE